MATYVLPQVLVFQDFQLVPAVVARPLRAWIAGGHAQLVRFDDPQEQADGRLDFYDNLVESCYEWPNREPGGIIDESYTKVFITDALLQYFEDPLSSGSMITKLAGFNNKIRSDTVNFKDNTAGELTFPRDPDLYDRDVQLGDVAKVRAVVGPDSYTLWASVIGFEGDILPSSVEAAEGDVNNAGSQALATSAVQIAGPENCITLTPDGSSYNGLVEGDINEIYTVVVQESSVGSDLTTAKLRILSASGNDEVDEIIPSPAGMSTDIGTRGLTVTFGFDATSSCSSDAADDEVEPDDLIAGQRFEVSVAQLFTAPTPTEGGTYNGTGNTTYIVEVTRGGFYAELPEVSVTTTNGIDLSGPTVIPAAATAIPVGTRGVTVEFDGAGLRKGDKYYIEVIAEQEGRIGTLCLSKNFDVAIPGGTEVGLTLFIRKPELEIPENREGFAPLVNWEQSSTEICLKPGIIAFDETWTDGGSPLPLPVFSESTQNWGIAYAEYRAWRQDLCFDVGTIDDVSQLNDLIPGPLDPDNELKWAVFKALSNSNGVEVKYTAVCDPSQVEHWIEALDLIGDRDDVYGLVPLSRDGIVQDLFAAHVDAQSEPEQGLWRVAWFTMEGIPTIPIVYPGNHPDGDEVLAVLEDDPNTSGSQFVLLRVPDGDGDFIQKEVRPGDIVRYLYVPDGFGNFEFSEFVVDFVLNEDELRLVSPGASGPVTVPQKIEIWRNLTATEEAEEIGRDAGRFGNRRIRSVWPDTIDSDGITQEGYHLCAALSGLSSGVLPHQGMTNLEIAGFSDVPRTIDKFNKFQLNTMAGAGVWIVSQERFTGQIFSRHAVTTGDNVDINRREEMITRNVDSISYRFKETFAPFIGISNVTPSMEAIIRTTTNALIEVLKGEAYIQRLGGQLIEGVIRDLRPHATLLDRYVLVLDLDVPEPLNNIEIRLVI
jgi:hypothetical protein